MIQISFGRRLVFNNDYINRMINVIICYETIADAIGDERKFSIEKMNK